MYSRGGVMIPATCNTPHCRQTLFWVEQFHGAVETKCPRCRTVHLYEYGSTGVTDHDVRCVNSFKGRDLGGWCGQLIGRITSDASGQLRYRCPRCKADKTLAITAPVLVST